MPYCPECGKEVSITDKRCSKCGTKLTDIPEPAVVKGKIEGMFGTSDKSHHNIEFAMAIFTIVLMVFSVSQYSSKYSFTNPDVFFLMLFFVIIGILGAILTRYFAKPGALIVLGICIFFMILGLPGIFLAIIFAVLTVIIAFKLN